MEILTIQALMIVFLAVLPCGIAGYLIAFKGRRGLICGYQESNFAEPKTFGKSVGISLLLFALGLAVIAYLWHLNFFTEQQMSFSVFLLVIAVLLNYLYSYVKYRKQNNE